MARTSEFLFDFRAAGVAQIHAQAVLASVTGLPRHATKERRAASVVTDPVTGQSAVRTPNRVLTVTYTLKGSTRTKQATGGQVLVLD